MDLNGSLLRRGAVVALASLVSATTFGASTILADQGGSTFDPATKAVSGSSSFDWDAGDTISLTCSQKGTEVAMQLILRDTGTGKLYVKVAFANPSVEWTGGQWVKHNEMSADTKVVPGDQLTEITLGTTVSGSKAAKNKTFVTGNPFVYTKDGGGNWVKLGHCNYGTGNANLSLRHWTVEWSADNSGKPAPKGPCFTDAAKSSMEVWQHIGVLSITQSDATKVLYSNKVIDDSWISGKSLTLWSGSKQIPTPIDLSATTGDTVWSGYHVWWGALGVTATTDAIDLTKSYRKDQVQGIGGNPGIWVGLGQVGDPDYDYYYLGRCNKL